MKVSYIRVSAVDQNTEWQIEMLKPFDIQRIFVEKVSGKDLKRPQLEAMMDFVRAGDVIYIESIARLARNTLDFLQIVKELGEKKVQLISLKENVDTSTPQGVFMLTVFDALYVLERESIKRRQREGIEVALKNGVKFGRPKVEAPKEFAGIYKEWKSGKIMAVEAMKKTNMKSNTFYRRVAEYEDILYELILKEAD